MVSSLVNDLTTLMKPSQEVCLLDYGGGCELTPSKLKECWKIAATSVKELCQLLEGALKEADDQAQKERLQRLQRQQHGDVEGSLPLSSSVENTPYFQQSGDNEDFMDIEQAVDSSEIEQAQTEAEEAYRQQALDYSRGHVAQAVREDGNDDRKSSYKQQAGSLLAAMLKSASKETTAAPSPLSYQAEPMEEESLNNKVETKAPHDKLQVAVAVGPSSTEQSNATDNGTRDPVPTKLDSDDEEEGPTVLRSEFESVPKADASSEKQEREPSKGDATEENEDDIADLSMAIKKKKKKGKSKKK
jgi:hypothetical protein